MSIQQTLDNSTFALYGAKHISTTGFGIPLFKAGNFRSNSLYTCLTKISGNLSSEIIDFEATSLESSIITLDERIVEIGSKWVGVFIHEDLVFSGNCTEIYSTSHYLHQDIKKVAPLSLLDLSMFCGSEDALSNYHFARSFIRDRFGESDLDGKVSEIIIRKFVSIAFSECYMHDTDLVEVPRCLENFSIRIVSDRLVLIVLEEECSHVFGEDHRAGFLRNANYYLNQIGFEVKISDFVLKGNKQEFENYILNDAVIPPRIGLRRRSRRFGLAIEVAIDVGTSVTRVYSADAGLLLEEPSVVALRQLKGKTEPIAFGDEALLIEGRNPDDIIVVRPIQDGAITDLDVATAMIENFIKKSKRKPSFLRPLDVVICVPLGSTLVERRAIGDAARAAGASRVSLILQPMAAAIGSAVPVLEPVGSFVINIGGGTTECAVIAMRGIAYSASLRVGGNQMTEDIISYFRRYHNILIGNATAERIKREFGVASPAYADRSIEFRVRGRDLVNGVPREILENQYGLSIAFEQVVNAIEELIRVAVENIPPELVADIVDQGIVMTGGGALLGSLDKFLQNETGLPVTIAYDASSSVSRGIGMAMSDRSYSDALFEI